MTQLDWEKARLARQEERAQATPFHETLGLRTRCWCGEAWNHDWPGKADGVPHPREIRRTKVPEQQQEEYDVVLTTDVQKQLLELSGDAGRRAAEALEKLKTYEQRLPFEHEARRCTFELVPGVEVNWLVLNAPVKVIVWAIKVDERD